MVVFSVEDMFVMVTVVFTSASELLDESVTGSFNVGKEGGW